MSSNVPLKILLVEDQPDIKIIAQIALEDIGKFQVCYCASGQEALENIEKFNPDLILLDVMMPGMDGTEVIKKIKTNDSFRHIPVVFMTAKVQPQEVQRYLNLGASYVISKPFEPMRLADQLYRVFKKANAS